MATATLAHWSSTLSSPLPPSPSHSTHLSLYNYLGCALSSLPHPALLHTTTALSFPPPPVPPSLPLPTLIHRANPPLTALLLGLASHLHDYDDTHLPTIIHPTGPIASSCLAYLLTLPPLSPPISGAKLLTAIAAGIEISCLLGRAVYPSHYDKGWHITCTTGSIGAAAAVAKLMDLDAEKTGVAMGLASAQAVGMRRHFGSHAKALGVGESAEVGLKAALLAREGVSCGEGAIEGKRGWVECVCPDAEAGRRGLEGLVKELVGEGRKEKKWEVEGNTFKPFPCGIVVHPVIDACVRMQREEGGVEVGEVERVRVWVHPLVVELTGKKEPRDGLEGKFSVYHGAAVGLMFGKATPAEYEDEVVTREEVVGLRRKIEAVVQEGMGKEQCRVEVTMKDGKKRELFVEKAVGSLENPMTEKQVQAKFLDQVEKAVGEERAKIASELCWSIGEMEDVRKILDIL
ncbi:MAG: hypothetical protein Q9227_006720 [Pyrenula ochraceoflavens]